MNLAIPEISVSELEPLSGEDLSSASLIGYSAESMMRAFRKLGPLFRIREQELIIVSGEEVNRDIWRARDLWGYHDTSSGDVFVTQLGEGYVTACDGDYHREQRSRLRPVTSPDATRQHCQTIYSCLTEGLKSLPDATVDLHDELIFLYTKILNQSMVKTGASDDWIKKFATFEEEFVRGVFISGEVRKAWFVRPDYQKLRAEVLGYFEDLVERRLAGETAGDNLDGLIEQMRDGLGSDSEIDRIELARNAYLLQAGGAGNIATVFCNLLWALVQHPQWLEAAREELQSCDIEELQKTGVKSIPVTRAVLLEAERRFAPTTAQSKVALQDTKLCGFDIAQGTEIQHLFALGNFSEEHYTDPLQFNPQRWIDGSPKRGILFGGGEHVCAGMHIANLFLLMSLVVILPNYKVSANSPPRTGRVDPNDSNSPQRLYFEARLSGLD